jgi:hypothetical protein
MMTDNQAQDKETPMVSEKRVRIIWDQGEDLPVQYANNFYVTHQGGSEFHLTFGHLIPPLTLGMTESEIPDILKVTPVSKIVLSPDSIEILIGILQSNLEKFQEKKRKEND